MTFTFVDLTKKRLTSANKSIDFEISEDKSSRTMTDNTITNQQKISPWLFWHETDNEMLRTVVTIETSRLFVTTFHFQVKVTWNLVATLEKLGRNCCWFDKSLDFLLSFKKTTQTFLFFSKVETWIQLWIENYLFIGSLKFKTILVTDFNNQKNSSE